MQNKKIRAAIDAAVDDMGEEETLLFTNHSYDDSIVGITDDGHVVYDLSKMVQEYSKDEKCSEEEALEWIEYNTLRAFSGRGKMPIIINLTKEEILERYGDDVEDAK